jgi:hypothetical protein
VTIDDGSNTDGGGIAIDSCGTYSYQRLGACTRDADYIPCSRSILEGLLSKVHDRSPVVAGSGENVEDGSFAINFARNLGEFLDSNFNTVIQIDELSI